MYTKQQLQTTIETLEILKTENPEQDTETYTVDYTIDNLIRYFLMQQQNKNDIVPENAYDRAMKGIK